MSTRLRMIDHENSFEFWIKFHKLDSLSWRLILDQFLAQKNTQQLSCPFRRANLSDSHLGDSVPRINLNNRKMIDPSALSTALSFGVRNMASPWELPELKRRFLWKIYCHVWLPKNIGCSISCTRTTVPDAGTVKRVWPQSKDRYGIIAPACAGVTWRGMNQFTAAIFSMRLDWGESCHRRGTEIKSISPWKSMISHSMG